MNHIPKDVLFILETLNNSGFEAYIVGGCVRDSILGRIPQDWDITTAAKPKEVKSLFLRTFDTGIQHGTVTVVLNQTNYEVTTYRVEGEYADCRHPSNVSFTNRLEEDLLRRDFTMNAIAYHPEEGFQDPFGGLSDIRLGIIRGVGEAALRFQEDALRMLRCVRFAAQLGFSVEEYTYAALRENAPLIQKISVERIREELDKLWLADFPVWLPLLWESGLLAEINPLLFARMQSRGAFLAISFENLPKDILLRWAFVLCDYTKEEAHALLKALKFDTVGLRSICTLVAYSKVDLPTEPYPLRKLTGQVGKETVSRLLLLQQALRPTSPYALSEKTFLAILENQDCLTLKDLAIDGKGLFALGVPKGKDMGLILEALLDRVHQYPEKNEYDLLVAIVKKMLPPQK